MFPLGQRRVHAAETAETGWGQVLDNLADAVATSRRPSKSLTKEKAAQP